LYAVGKFDGEFFADRAHKGCDDVAVQYTSGWAGEEGISNEDLSTALAECTWVQILEFVGDDEVSRADIPLLHRLWRYYHRPYGRYINFREWLATEEEKAHEEERGYEASDAQAAPLYNPPVRRGE